MINDALNEILALGQEVEYADYLVSIGYLKPKERDAFVVYARDVKWRKYGAELCNQKPESN